VRKRQLKKILKDCDYKLAAAALKHQFAGGVIKKDLAILLDAYLANPSFDTAMDLIAFDEVLLVFFAESSEGGFFDRHLGK